MNSLWKWLPVGVGWSCPHCEGELHTFNLNGSEHCGVETSVMFWHVHLWLVGLLSQSHRVYNKAACSWSVATHVKATFVPNVFDPVKFHGLFWSFWRWLDGCDSSSEVSSRAHAYAIGMKCHQQLGYENAVSWGMSWASPAGRLVSGFAGKGCDRLFFFLNHSALHFFLMEAFPVILLLNEEASLFLEDLNWIQWIRQIR